MKSFLILCLLLITNGLIAQEIRQLNNQKIDGYRGIWFELNQKYDYGDKYSGGLGTYTAKHIPLAIYAPEVNKTFFVYGGTTNETERHLLCMIGEFDHKKKKVARPTIVYDKMEVDDPHDNPSIMIGENGYIWVFVSGRGTKRKGIKLKSKKPYNIDAFEIVQEETFTYPQIWNTDYGYFHFFTKYTGTRELYFETSIDGYIWSEDQKLAGIKEKPTEKSGHYQVSNHYKNGSTIGTFFNRHRNGHPDARTDLYYIQSKDFGHSWQNVEQQSSTIPLEAVAISEQVIDYQSQQKNVYLKDMSFDSRGNPICLYITSGGHEPGPMNAPYEWRVTYWNNTTWITEIICNSDHNYDMGSLYVSDTIWKVVAPTGQSPQKYGVGGEIEIWTRNAKDRKWRKEIEVTQNSTINNSYVRRPVNAKAPFCYFWASGNPDNFSISELYFGDFEGQVWKLPYQMKKSRARPILVSK